MNVPGYAAAAAKFLGRHVPGARHVAGDREHGIVVIQRAMAARVRRRRLIWGGFALVSAAAALLVVQSWRPTGLPGAAAAAQVSIAVSPAGRGAALHAGARSTPLPEGAALESGQCIETPEDGGASLRLSTGTAMDLGGATSFRVDSQGAVQRFSLQRGRLSAKVAKLTTGQRFIVATPDAEIEVRGTRFDVHVLERGEACGAGSRSRLEVSEGVVEVRGAGVAVSVKAGQHWPADCSVAPSALGPGAAKPPGDRAAPPAENGGVAARGALQRSSALAQQNDLFAEGVALRRQGDVSGALRIYQEVIARFPTSPLAENALVERMRLLSVGKDARAGAEARRYVARYPHGFAVEEARQLAAKP